MQELQDFVARPSNHGTRLVLCSAVSASEDRLRQFEVPIAIDIPDETVHSGRRVIETIGGDRFGDFSRGLCGFMRDPPVQGFVRPARIEDFSRSAAIDLSKASRVPEFGSEIAVTLDALCRQLNI